MDTLFMNLKNSQTSDPHRLTLNLSDTINLKRRDMLPYQILPNRLALNLSGTINLKRSDMLPYEILPSNLASKKLKSQRK